MTIEMVGLMFLENRKSLAFAWDGTTDARINDTTRKRLEILKHSLMNSSEKMELPGCLASLSLP